MYVFAWNCVIDCQQCMHPISVRATTAAYLLLCGSPASNFLSDSEALGKSPAFALTPARLHAWLPHHLTEAPCAAYHGLFCHS